MWNQILSHNKGVFSHKYYVSYIQSDAISRRSGKKKGEIWKGKILTAPKQRPGMMPLWKKP